MTIQTVLILFSIVISAGLLGGFVGEGGGIIIVPALVFLVGLSQHEAQGTSLFILSMPVVLLGVMNYWKSGDVNWKYGLVIALTFFIGAYFGSKLSLKLQPGMVKFLFGLLMAVVSVKLILSGYSSITSDGD